MTLVHFAPLHLSISLGLKLRFALSSIVRLHNWTHNIDFFSVCLSLSPSLSLYYTPTPTQTISYKHMHTHIAVTDWMKLILGIGPEHVETAQPESRYGQPPKINRYTYVYGMSLRVQQRTHDHIPTVYLKLNVHKAHMYHTCILVRIPPAVDQVHQSQPKKNRLIYPLSMFGVTWICITAAFLGMIIRLRC
jgi:hypothetical protein